MLAKCELFQASHLACVEFNSAWVGPQDTGHDFPAPACDFLIMREGRKIDTKIAQAWNVSHETILDFSPLNVGPTATLFSSSQKPDVSLYTSENKFANKSIYTGLHSIYSCFK